VGEIWVRDYKITFLDTVVFKGERNIEKSILDIETHYRPTETFQYSHVSSCHPLWAKRGFIKGEAIRLLRTNSSKTTFAECLANFKRSFKARGYPTKYIEKSLSEVSFDSRHWSLIENQPLLKTVFVWDFPTLCQEPEEVGHAPNCIMG